MRKYGIDLIGDNGYCRNLSIQLCVGNPSENHCVIISDQAIAYVVGRRYSFLSVSLWATGFALRGLPFQGPGFPLRSRRRGRGIMYVVAWAKRACQGQRGIKLSVGHKVDLRSCLVQQDNITCIAKDLIHDAIVFGFLGI